MALPGGQRAVQRLVDEHYVALYRYAFRLSGAADQAADLTQETFCKAQAQLNQLRDPQRAKPWLYSILRNAYLHRERAEPQHRLLPLDNVAELCQVPPDPFPDGKTEKLQAALNDLPVRLLSPLLL